MALITTGSAGGNGGSLPAEWTVDDAGDVEVAPTDDTATYLTSIKAPAGFFDNSPNGTMLRLVDENDNVIVEMLVECQLNLTAQAGFFQSVLNLRSVDNPDDSLAFGSGTGVDATPFIQAKVAAGEVFAVDGNGHFRVHPATDGIAFTAESPAGASGITMLVNAGSGQTGNLIEVDVLPDGNPGFVVGPNGEIKMTFLPTADPHVAGQLWNSSGVVHVSAG